MDSQDWAAYCTDCDKWLNLHDGHKEEMLLITFQHVKEASFRGHIVYIGYRLVGFFRHSNYLAFRFNHRVGQLADFLDEEGSDDDKIRTLLHKLEHLESPNP